jgi:hypothetical protein
VREKKRGVTPPFDLLAFCLALAAWRLLAFISLSLPEVRG